MSQHSCGVIPYLVLILLSYSLLLRSVLASPSGYVCSNSLSWFLIGSYWVSFHMTSLYSFILVNLPFAHSFLPLPPHLFKDFSPQYFRSVFSFLLLLFIYSLYLSNHASRSPLISHAWVSSLCPCR